MSTERRPRNVKSICVIILFQQMWHEPLFLPCGVKTNQYFSHFICDPFPHPYFCALSAM